MRTLELLSPAKNLQCGIAAIDHGADAVYIGARRFGARATAGNSIEDIAKLCQYAHLFGTKVYVTVNTIIYDEELDDTRQLLNDLKSIHVDAVLVQDMALLDINTCQMVMHASTQTDNRSVEKVRWLQSLGFKRVVLARELSVQEIATIHQAVPDIELEAFVHGALCVSYSGLCYASQHCFGRSANRGECAQFCRMKFDLVDSSNKVLESQKHLLSLKDMRQYQNLDRLAEAGVTSFKIEGRLKDIDYVKNVTAAYSERLNEIVARHPQTYRRASLGRVTYSFTPNLNKSFNRGFTSYFADGRQPGIASFDTPKAMGEYVGNVKELRGTTSFNVAGTSRFANGDGLCFINDQRELEGFRVNRVEGNRIFPQKMPASLRPGVRLYRNNDQEFERILSRPSSERKIPVTMSLMAVENGFSLSMDDTTIITPFEHQVAQKSQRENIIRQLTKLGGTPYECVQFDIDEDFCFFIPGSVLSEMRRTVVSSYESHHQGISTTSNSQTSSNHGAALEHLPAYERSYFYNISNKVSSQFYLDQGLRNPSIAFELHEPQNALIMQCRHCLRYALGGCLKNGGQKKDWREPLYLRLIDGQRFRLEFDCNHCQMNVYAEDR
jgi:putative protease